MVRTKAAYARKGVARDELAIGCDFGMTYSSAAFLKPRKGTSVSVDIRDVSTIKEYSLKAMHEEEGPSTVCYISPHDLGNQRYFEAYNLRGADQNPPEFMVLYGHEVVHQYRNPNSGGYQKSSRDIRIDNFKILLDTRKTTKVLPGQQEELQNVENKIRLTIDRGCITNRLDPLRHFLKRWLCDVLKYLDRSHNVNKTTSKICFAVPSGWPSDTGRTLIKCVADALRHAKIGDEGTIAGLSFLNENLLAAVTCIRLLENFDNGNAVLVLDSGGYSINTATYRIGNVEPLAFESLLTRPNSCRSSSTLVDLAVQKQLRKILEPKRHQIEYPAESKTLDGIINGSLTLKYSPLVNGTFILVD